MKAFGAFLLNALTLLNDVPGKLMGTEKMLLIRVWKCSYSSLEASESESIPRRADAASEYVK